MEGSHAHHRRDPGVCVQLVHLPLEGEDVGARAGGQTQEHKLSQGLEGVVGPVEGGEVEAAVDHG